MKQNIMAKVKKELAAETIEKVVQIKRVNKVVKGGKRLAFRATVIVGDQNGGVGVGIGKATEVPSAIKKAIDSAKKGIFGINVTGETIPHEITGEFNASKVFLKPAPKGTGVIAGGVVRIILELAGIKNIVAKSQGSGNAINSARATLDGLLKLKNAQEIANLRGKEISIKYVGDDKITTFKPQQETVKREDERETRKHEKIEEKTKRTEVRETTNVPVVETAIEE
ncbi:MAG: 30S ribosomal protein S5 [Candidatus Margulisbacteria bacterium GWF2_38_17]|nr:MAG: 30S ribosomal protein S5 [Candidatus Margulisbacteria bacterium GWD2_39_127]OGI04627.1 MAG: 30S ribosomal protein S5 [Candidatus Margulisbacteria bacterium GWF2_38_17]OGI11841.1 MAG: 30S ribosomal protein S5 [Candidatus Margulisbacteria bacterium GWE2_39_32]